MIHLAGKVPRRDGAGWGSFGILKSQGGEKCEVLTISPHGYLIVSWPFYFPCQKGTNPDSTSDEIDIVSNPMQQIHILNSQAPSSQHSSRQNSSLHLQHSRCHLTTFLSPIIKHPLNLKPPLPPPLHPSQAYLPTPPPKPSPSHQQSARTKLPPSEARTSHTSPQETRSASKLYSLASSAPNHASS
jgi:hypothetical protein